MDYKKIIIISIIIAVLVAGGYFAWKYFTKKPDIPKVITSVGENIPNEKKKILIRKMKLNMQNKND